MVNLYSAVEVRNIKAYVNLTQVYSCGIPCEKLNSIAMIWETDLITVSLAGTQHSNYNIQLHKIHELILFCFNNFS